MKLDWAWLQRRFFEFRVGDSLYTRHFIGLIQFIVIIYVLAIERFSFLEAVFASMGLFALTFFCMYIPLNIIVGHFLHLRKQLSVEHALATKQNPWVNDLCKVMIMIAPEDKKDEVRELMKKWIRD